MAIVPRRRHPALDASESERIDYLTAVASMAAADHDTSEEEIAQLRKMCQALAISREGVEQVVAAARSPDKVAIEEILDRLRASEMRYALLVDALSIAYADSEFDPAESDEVMALAEKLEVPKAQALLVYRYVENYRKRGNGPSDAKTAAKLVGTGIPVAALAVTAAAGAPLAAGVGLAAALGVSSYMSVRWLFRHSKGAKKPRRERRAIARAKRKEKKSQRRASKRRVRSSADGQPGA